MGKIKPYTPHITHYNDTKLYYMGCGPYSNPLWRRRYSLVRTTLGYWFIPLLDCKRTHVQTRELPQRMGRPVILLDGSRRYHRRTNRTLLVL